MVETRLTVDGVAGVVKGARVILEADDGEDEDREQHEQRDLHQRGHRAQNRLEHHLETCTPHRTALREALADFRINYQ